MEHFRLEITATIRPLDSPFEAGYRREWAAPALAGTFDFSERSDLQGYIERFGKLLGGA
jgi:hypothetical protein